MNINAINNSPLPQPQQAFRGKAPQKFVQIITEQRPLSQYTRDFLLPQFAEISKIARKYGKPVRVAQLEGEKLLVNVGSLTKVIDANKTRSVDLPMVLSNLIKGNSIAEERGLQKGLSYIV